MLTLTDDYSRKKWIFVVGTRDEVYQKFLQWRRLVESQSGEKLVAVRSDNAPEFKKLLELEELKEVTWEPTETYSPHQNGTAERLNRTIVTKSRSMLAAAGLPKNLWGEAVHVAAYVENRIPPPSSVLTPEELWTGKKPDVKHMRVFGCIAYVHMPKEKRKKLDETARRGIFVGYSESKRQYRIFDPKNRKITFESSVKFDENKQGSELYGSMIAKQDKYALMPDGELEEEELGEETRTTPSTPQIAPLPGSSTSSSPAGESVQFYSPQGSSEQPLEQQTPTPAENVTLRRSGRTRKPPKRYEDTAYGDEAEHAYKVDYQLPPGDVPPKPLTYEEAIHGPYGRLWKLAFEEQIGEIFANDLAELVLEPPPDINIVDVKWVMRIKYLPNSQVDKFKVRLVAKGFTQQEGVDYQKERTFAPVARLESKKAIMAIAAARKLLVEVADIVSAFMKPELKEEIYVRVPEGIEAPPGAVLRLNKAMPGLRQAAREWSDELGGEFEALDMVNLPADNSVWTNQERTIFVSTHVDDLMIAAPEQEDIDRIKAHMASKYEIHELGPISVLLGIQITRDWSKGTISLSQAHYIKIMAEEYGITTTSTAPIRNAESLTPIAEGEEPANIAEYGTLISKINWVTRGTRGDTAFVAQRLSQYTHNPAEKHMAIALNVVKYLLKTIDYVQTFGTKTDNQLTVYADSDHAGDQESRRSTIGYVYMLNGGAISWSSKKMRTVALSTHKAEYHALGNAAKEAI